MRIVAYAYACEPDKGSEPGAGWGLVRVLGGFAETHVITRANNRASIEAALPSIPERDRLHFHYLDVAGPIAAYKRGQRGVRLYYLAWQRAALRVARDLHETEPFDLAWHLTLGNAWLGSNLGKLETPFVFGPVGGGVRPPRQLLSALGTRGITFEMTRRGLQLWGRWGNPNARAAWDKASLILTQNPETTAWFPRSARPRCRVFQHALLEESAVRDEDGGRETGSFVFLGRLIPWKGLALAIDALARNPGARYLVFGDGPDRTRLEALARHHGVHDRVEFRGSLPRAELGAILENQCAALLFPSLHDDSPLAVAEAAAAGLPVICLDVGGPQIVAKDAAVAVNAEGSRDEVVSRLASAIADRDRWPKSWDRSANTIPARRGVLVDLLSENGLGP
jgi:glycosyltransferase involved in cell wall biosynthesis